MKKYLLPILMFLFVPVMVFGQNCMPDQSLSQPGYYPQQLPVGMSGAAYSGTIQFVIPQDTQVVYMGSSVNADIDSIKVNGVIGLPGSLTYMCNPSSCALPGGQTSCGNIYGTIDTNEVGTYPIIIPVTIYARIGGSFPVQQKDTIRNFSIDVNGPNSIHRASVKKILIYPNPTNGPAQLLLAEDAENAELVLFNMAGKEIKVPTATRGQELILDTQELESGVYFGTVRTAENTYRFKLIRR